MLLRLHGLWLRLLRLVQVTLPGVSRTGCRDPMRHGNEPG
jgi:hypothetical protein